VKRKILLIALALFLALLLRLALAPPSRGGEPPGNSEDLNLPMSRDGVTGALGILEGRGYPTGALVVIVGSFFSTKTLAKELSYIAALRCFDLVHFCVADYFVAVRWGKVFDTWRQRIRIPELGGQPGTRKVWL
jgi:hypothetical protein